MNTVLLDHNGSTSGLWATCVPWGSFWWPPKPGLQLPASSHFSSFLNIPAMPFQLLLWRRRSQNGVMERLKSPATHTTASTAWLLSLLNDFGNSEDGSKSKHLFIYLICSNVQALSFEMSLHIWQTWQAHLRLRTHFVDMLSVEKPVLWKIIEGYRKS